MLTAFTVDGDRCLRLGRKEQVGLPLSGAAEPVTPPALQRECLHFVPTLAVNPEAGQVLSAHNTGVYMLTQTVRCVAGVTDMQ